MPIVKVPQAKEASEEDKRAEEILRTATPAPEPGSAEKIIKDNVQGNPVELTITELTSAGYTYMWDTRTGERSLTNNNMLRQQLQKKRPDGSFVFTLTNPNIKVKRGEYKCMLHQDDPKRAEYDKLGLPVCKKSNLTNPYEVRRHMQKRHPSAWEAIEEQRKSTQEGQMLELLGKVLKK